METLADGGVFGGEWGAGKRRHISWRGGENGVFRFIRSVAAGRGGSRLLLRDFENGGEEIAGAGRSFTGGRVASGKSRRGAGSAPGLPTSLFRGPRWAPATGKWGRCCGGRASQGNRRSATATFQEAAGSGGGVPESAGKGETLLPAEPAGRPSSREIARDQKS